MPNLDATRLEATGTRIFAAMGAPAADAAWISMLLVRANLRGHDSHGVIRIPQYWASVKEGVVDPASPVTVTMETPVMARLDGGRHHVDVLCFGDQIEESPTLHVEGIPSPAPIPAQDPRHPLH